jgi:serine/threonine protein kinase/Tfp pilus assembly protein PilF
MTPQQYERLTELFHDALELAPGERAAFLEQVSDGDADLRRELESLLAAHEQGAFTEKPPEDIAAGLYLAQQKGSADGTASLTPNTRLDHYEIRSLLGKGGMGEVYLAEDMRLHRKVALKILPAAVASNRDRMRRFEQEAAAAAALNHPHIAHIYEIGESESIHFIAIEHIDGDTLRDRLHRDKAPLEKLLKYLIQVAEGLSKAHGAGIVHRDLKPDNIMITHDDYAKILDFGLAKLIDPQRPAGASSVASGEVGTAFMAEHSLAGMVMGTAGYMSPEQAQGRVKEIDHRSDIFSFGCILFEAVTGHKPFADESITKSLHRVAYEAEPPIRDYNPSAPPDLQRIVRLCLAKDREERYQTIKDVAVELKEVRRAMAGAAELVTPRPSSGSTQSLSWRGSKQSARSTSSAEYLVSQIKRYKRSAAFASAALVIAVAALAYFFKPNRAPALTEQDTILLTDFDNQTGDEIFDATLKQGLAVQLEQSPFLNLFPDTRVRSTLKLMSRSTDERVTSEIGREICQRQGLKALIASSIAPLGSHYVVTLSAINSNTGEVLAREQMEAENREQVLKALSQAASRLREKLGESLSSIQKFDAPLEATTSSLEALKAYALGLPLYASGKWPAAILYFNRAVEIDPNFALAYKTLAFSYANISQSGLAAQYAAKAYALRNRVSEREKLAILDSYYLFVTGEVDKRIDLAELRKRLYPHDASAFTNLSLAYGQIGQFEKAVPESLEALRLTPHSTVPYAQLGQAFISLDRFAEAREIYKQALQQNLDFTSIHSGSYQIAFASGDTAAMQQQIDWAKGKPNEYEALDWQTGAAAFAGQWRRAQALSRRSIDLAVRSDAKEVAAGYAAEEALRNTLFGQCTQTKAAATQALTLEHHRLTTARAMLALAWCGEASQAQRLIDDLVKSYPKDTRINGLWHPTISAAIELRRGNAQQVIDLLEGAKRYEAAAQFWPQYLRGLAYLKLVLGAEAAVEFQKILDHRGQAPLSVLYPLAHLNLARAAAINGDATKARQAYRDFFAIWKDADADLPLLIEAKKEYEKVK